MNHQQNLKEGEYIKRSENQNSRKKDPREGSENEDNDDEQVDKKDAITDLDIAYSIIYDEMNKEYIREKERVKRKQEGEKAAIPHRVFQSFLVSMENDINEYSDNVHYHKQLIREEKKLKIGIERDRKALIREKKENGEMKSKLVVLKDQHSQLKKKYMTLKNTKEIAEKMKRFLQSHNVIYSIPTVPVTQQVNSYDLLQGINESIENKLKILKERNS